MTQIGNVYGGALYALARDEGISEIILRQLQVLDHCFHQEPEFLWLLDVPNLSKISRLQILDDSFRGKVKPYVLNFLKILTEKGYIRHFGSCVQAYREFYDQDNGLLPVTAVTAVALTDTQKEKISDRLHRITGKRIALTNELDPTVLGGIRLDYDGKRVDGTIAHRLTGLRTALKSTVL